MRARHFTLSILLLSLALLSALRSVMVQPISAEQNTVPISDEGRIGVDNIASNHLPTQRNNGHTYTANFTVNSTVDAVDANPGDNICATTSGICTLRAAIQEANALVGNDTIILPANIYTLSIIGPGEDIAATGDLDIVSDLTITVTGMGDAIIKGEPEWGDRILHIIGTDTNLKISNVTIQNGNVSGFEQGGGIKNGGNLELINVTVNYNESGCGGGGIESSGVLTITNSVINNNLTGNCFPGVGGGGVSAGVAIIENSYISNNISNGGGGGIHGWDRITLNNSTIYSNTAYGGAGISIGESSAIMTITHSAISDNNAIGVNGYGGGLSNIGTVTVWNSTISSNSSQNNGGGIGTNEYNAGSTLNLNNVTITDNIVQYGNGGGIYNPIGTINFGNTILAGNTDIGGEAPDCSGTLVSHGYNLIRSLSGCAIVGDTTGNQVNIDPILGFLKDNGGNTFTHALLDGSPAIDSGNPDVPGSSSQTCLTTDQRGISRPQGTRCDIGAYEAVGVSDKPPIVFVHGWQGASLPSNCTEDHKTQRIQDIKDDNGNYFSEVDDLLENAGYPIYYAHLISNPCYTPPVEGNAQYVKEAIDQATRETGHDKAILIAHSMGGLVSRAYLESSDYEQDISALYTFGTPHHGTPADLLLTLAFGAPGVDTLNAYCTLYQPAVCDFTTTGAAMFNLFHFKRAEDVAYHLISGDAPFETRNAQAKITDFLIPFGDDGIVPTSSGRGIFLSGISERWETDENHGNFSNEAYHWTYFDPRITAGQNVGESRSYQECLKPILVDGENNCIANNALNIPESVFQTDVMPDLTVRTPFKSGTLLLGETITQTFALEGGAAMFATRWTTGTLTVTLQDPSGQTIDPAYAIAHPDIVTYTADADSATYVFTDTLAGAWQMGLSASGDVPAEGSAYLTFAALDSAVTLTAGTDRSWYTPGATAAITATLSGSPSSAAVTAIVRRSDGVTETLTLSPGSGDLYEVAYTIPAAAGYTQVDISATGVTSGGAAFERGATTLFQIAPNTIELIGSYSETPEPRPANPSLYDALNVHLNVSATVSGTFGLSADLLAADGTFVAHGLILQDLVVGSQTMTLRFAGSDIFASGQNGPYTLTNLLLTDNRGAALAVTEAENVYTTAAYEYAQFGEGPKVYLPLIVSD